MVGLEGVAWHRLLFLWCEEEEEEEEEEEASSQVRFLTLCPHLVFWTVFYEPLAFQSMLGVYVPYSYVSHGGVLEDIFGFWGARGTGNAVSWEMASRTRFCIQRNAWSSVHVMRQSTEFFVYVDTDPELDSPALAGVFNAPVPFFHGPLYLAATGSAFAAGVQDHGLFWEITSGCFPYPTPVGSTLDTCYFSLRRLFGFRMQKTVESPQLQSITVVDFFFLVHRQISMVLLFSRP